jgi:transposase InsO family protein
VARWTVKIWAFKERSGASPPAQLSATRQLVACWITSIVSSGRHVRVSDLTYVATWAGFVYVAFVIDAYARRIVG